MIRRTRCRMNVCCGLLALLLSFIWGNSLLPGHISGAFSDWLKNVLTDLFPFLFSGMPGNTGGGLLRKLAHFSEFTALGVCFSWLYGMLISQRHCQLLYAVISGIIVACVDETIQRFVPLRNGCLTDVGIDTSGVITGIILFFIAYVIRKKMQHNTQKNTRQSQ